MTSLNTGLHKDFESSKHLDKEGREFWYARELAPLLGYKKWENFSSVLIKAMKSCKSASVAVLEHFPEVRKVLSVAQGAKMEVVDYKLSRYACYLIAQNGDPRKEEIALAQTYFAVQTRKQELQEELAYNEKRVMMRNEVTHQNKKLVSRAKEHGVKNFGKFHNAGYKGLYGMTSKEIQEKKQIEKDHVLDRAGSTELAANLFRITQTEDLLKQKLEQRTELGEVKSTQTHFEVGKKVRKAITDIGGTMPEDLPAESHIHNIKKSLPKSMRNKTISSQKNNNQDLDPEVETLVFDNPELNANGERFAKIINKKLPH